MEHKTDVLPARKYKLPLNWDRSQEILPLTNIGLVLCCCPLTAFFSCFFFFNYDLLNDAVTASKFITNSVKSRILEKRMISQLLDEWSSSYESRMLIILPQQPTADLYSAVALQFTPSFFLIYFNIILTSTQKYFRHFLSLKRWHQNCMTFFLLFTANKSLARPGRKQATATEDFDVHISSL